MSVEPSGPPSQADGAAPPRRSSRLPLAERLRLGLGVLPTPESRFRHVRDSLARHYPQADLTILDRAFDFAARAHHDQSRVTGEPYITHPVASAQILADIGLDPVAVTAAILHDVPEDTDFTLGDVEEAFGTEVAQLVDGVTKLSKFSTHTHEEQQAENIRKMFLAMADDIRVVLIKLADRLHNMRTLYALPSDKQQRIARQTLEI